MQHRQSSDESYFRQDFPATRTEVSSEVIKAEARTCVAMDAERGLRANEDVANRTLAGQKAEHLLHQGPQLPNVDCQGIVQVGSAAALWLERAGALSQPRLPQQAQRSLNSRTRVIPGRTNLRSIRSYTICGVCESAGQAVAQYRQASSRTSVRQLRFDSSMRAMPGRSPGRPAVSRPPGFLPFRRCHGRLVGRRCCKLLRC